MKKLLLISAMTLVLATCGVPSNADITEETKEETSNTQVSFLDMIVQMKQEQTLLQQQQAEWEALQIRIQKMDNRVDKLSKHVGSTWYAFAGSTPNGWDCSGLVLWFYSEFGVQLEHSATKQKFSGEFTEQPMPGDIIAFSYPGNEKAYHNGIYIGDGLFIHSPRPGKATRLSIVDDYVGEHSEVTYTRINF